VAAWLIFLNRVGFNGLYRVNSRNQFNVPFGRYANPTICDETNLRLCSAALAGAEIGCEDFAAVLDRARPGDLVYFDPPYLPLSATSAFTSYTSGGFGLADHQRLRDVALTLKRRGVFVLLSNSSAGAVRELYGPPFACTEVPVTRSVNSDATKRGAVTELLIT
jgi:DNA adenine methylase